MVMHTGFYRWGERTKAVCPDTHKMRGQLGSECKIGFVVHVHVYDNGSEFACSQFTVCITTLDLDQCST